MRGVEVTTVEKEMEKLWPMVNVIVVYSIEDILIMHMYPSIHEQYMYKRAQSHRAQEGTVSQYMYTCMTRSHIHTQDHTIIRSCIQ